MKKNYLKKANGDYEKAVQDVVEDIEQLKKLHYESVRIISLLTCYVDGARIEETTSPKYYQQEKDLVSALINKGQSHSRVILYRLDEIDEVMEGVSAMLRAKNSV